MINLTPLSTPLKGTIEAPGDKSISHRSIILGALAKGITTVENILLAEDCNRTIECFKRLGVSISYENEKIVIKGEGPILKEPKEPLYFGNSGTTARLMLGVLAGQPFFTSVYGDKYLSKRPMKRVVKPLELMGANIDGRCNGQFLPLSIKASELKSIRYKMPVDSAQVKSAILLASLYAKGNSTVIEEGITRNHTENMLKAFGANVEIKANEITLKSNNLIGANIFVPGDISSAAFFIVAALIVPNSLITIKNVNLNETRTGILTVIKQMGATYEISNRTMVNNEAMGDITIKHQSLFGTVIEGDLIPLLIDELPIIALLATQCEGQTIIRNAEELRVKETDRIKATVQTLNALGAEVIEARDGMIIQGKTSLLGGKVKSFYDHRIAMMAVIASLICENNVLIDELNSINISYPSFLKDLKTLTEH